MFFFQRYMRFFCKIRWDFFSLNFHPKYFLTKWRRIQQLFSDDIFIKCPKIQRKSVQFYTFSVKSEDFYQDFPHPLAHFYLKIFFTIFLQILRWYEIYAQNLQTIPKYATDENFSVILYQKDSEMRLHPDILWVFACDRWYNEC